MPNQVFEPVVQTEQEHYTKVLKDPECQMPHNGPAIEGNVALLPPAELESLRNRWHEIQAGFIDEPNESVRKADGLVDEVIRRLSEVFASERTRLEQAWGKSGEVSTEDFRQALRHYRSFFDRLLSV